MTNPTEPSTGAIAGCLLGCAVGDAIGLPYEGISRRRGVRLFGEPDRHRFLFGRGMVSDDTEHTCMVAQSLCEHPLDPDAFARAFARRLRWWLLGIPAGVGLATLKATVKLWLGFSSARSGIFSAGNGPAMRSAILGAAIDDLALLQRFVFAATRITHTDPKAFDGAMAVAFASWCSKRGILEASEFFRRYRELPGNSPSPEFVGLLEAVERGLSAGKTVMEFADEIGCGKGVSGYVYRTVPVVLFAWLRHPDDFRIAVMEIIHCGGDTDTTGAIVGAIIGSGAGQGGIPQDWRDGLWEWTRSVSWMQRLAENLEQATGQGTPVDPPRVVPMVGLVRNALFVGAVMLHVIRRALPPY